MFLLTYLLTYTPLRYVRNVEHNEYNFTGLSYGSRIHGIFGVKTFRTCNLGPKCFGTGSNHSLQPVVVANVVNHFLADLRETRN